VRIYWGIVRKRGINIACYKDGGVRRHLKRRTKPERSKPTGLSSQGVRAYEVSLKYASSMTRQNQLFLWGRTTQGWKEFRTYCGGQHQQTTTNNDLTA
jgi:hypothetical protein